MLNMMRCRWFQLASHLDLCPKCHIKACGELYSPQEHIQSNDWFPLLKHHLWTFSLNKSRAARVLALCLALASIGTANFLSLFESWVNRSESNRGQHGSASNVLWYVLIIVHIWTVSTKSYIQLLHINAIKLDGAAWEFIERLHKFEKWSQEGL